MEWEYLTIHAANGDLQDKLNRCGNCEWELVQIIVRYEWQYLCIFKRHKRLPESVWNSVFTAEPTGEPCSP